MRFWLGFVDVGYSGPADRGFYFIAPSKTENRRDISRHSKRGWRLFDVVEDAGVVTGFTNGIFASTTFYSIGPRIASDHSTRYSGGGPNMVSMTAVSVEYMFKQAILWTMPKVFAAYPRQALQPQTSET